MGADIEQLLAEVQRAAARGDYSGARRRLESALADLDPEHPGQDALTRQRRTLEVLEGLDVVRQLLREGNGEGAARASHSIIDALAADEYSRLGVIGAAFTLLGRAGELARRLETDSRSASTRDEVGAFVSYLGTELAQLERENVTRALQQLAGDDANGASRTTLGDLLSRRPWRSNLRPALEAVPEPAAKAAPPAEPGVSPVIGRIVIEQEERERVQAVPVPAAAAGGAGQDLFDIVGKAAFAHWTYVLATALVFGFFGYLIMMLAPQRFESSALLQKTQQSGLWAPITGRTDTYMPSLPPQTVLQLATLPSFHERVAKRLSGLNAAPAPRVAEIAQALTVKVDTSAGSMYSIRFTAIHADAASAQAIAGAAAEEFQVVHLEHVTREAGESLKDYERRGKLLDDQLATIRQKRLEEFQLGDGAGLGVTIEARIDHLISELRGARLSLNTARTELTAARQEEEYMKELAERLPLYEADRSDTKLEALRQLLVDLEREIYELARKRSDFGPDHPMQTKIRELQEDARLIEKEIEELESGQAADADKRRVSPVRAQADDRYAQARAKTAAAELRQKQWEAEVPRLETELSRLRGSLLSSEGLRRDEDNLLKQQQRNAVVVEELNAVKNSAGRELALVSPAAEAQPVPREVLVGIAVGLILGLVVGIGIAVALLRRRQQQEAAAA